MTRFFSTFGLMLIIAASSCPTDSCSTGDCEASKEHTDQSRELTKGSRRPLTTVCNTCGHASAQVTWTVNNAVTSGDITLFALYSCGSVAQGTTPWSVEAKTTVDAATKRLTLVDLAAKNVCGEKSAITWTVWVDNNTIDTDITAQLLIDCPEKAKGASTSLAGPSSIK
jgi:hypothetical protein